VKRLLAAAVTIAAALSVGADTAHADYRKPGPGTAEQWNTYRQRARGHVQAISEDLAQVRAASATRSEATITAACAAFGQTAAASAGIVDRSPSKAVNRMWREALFSYATSSALCVDGNYQASADAIANGNQLVGQARDRVAEIRARFE
jgi:hypothetical protein